MPGSLPAIQNLTPPQRLILVIDKELEGRDMTALMLSLEGFTVQVVTDRKSAIEALEKNVPVVALLEWQMFGVDIQDFIRATVTYKTKMILVTGTMGIAKKAEQAGIKWFIPKPFHPDTVKSVIRSALT